MADYATLSQLKGYLRIDSSSEDDLLASLISTASRLIDERCGRTFTSYTATRYYEATGPHMAGSLLLLDEDLLSVTQIVNGDGSLMPLDRLLLRPINTPPYFGIAIKQGSGLRWRSDEDSNGAIAVTGTWGFSSSPPDIIVHATLRLASWLYRQRDSGGEAIEVEVSEQGVSTAPARLPRDVTDLIALLVRFRMSVPA